MARPQTISDEKILETARECFLEHGPHVSTDVIAQELGVSSQALFKRFHTKQELLLASIAPCDPAPWIPLVESGPTEAPFREQFTVILNQISDFFLDVSRRINVLRWSGVSSDDIFSRFEEPPPLVDIRILSAWFRRAFEKGLIREVDFEATAMLVLTSLHGPEMLTDMLGQRPTHHTQSQYVEFLTELLLGGLASSD